MDIPEQRTGRLQAEHLAATGHRNIGYAWPADHRVISFAQPRLDGVRQACADLGLAEPHVIPVPLTPDGETAAVNAWLAANPPITGVCAYNDEVALAVIAGVQRQGLNVPTDLAVIGVDDIPTAAAARPTLTTVRADSPTPAWPCRRGRQPAVGDRRRRARRADHPGWCPQSTHTLPLGTTARRRRGRAGSDRHDRARAAASGRRNAVAAGRRCARARATR